MEFYITTTYIGGLGLQPSSLCFNMAKKKAELETDANRYHKLVAQMRLAHEHHDHQQAIAIATAAWEFVDGMMQFERRFENRTERNNLVCIDYVIRFAPLLLEIQPLYTLSLLLQTQKRIDKNTAADLANDLTSAFAMLKDAHRLWDHLERHAGVDQNALRTTLGGDQDRWRWLAEQWVSMGLIRRVPSNQGSYVLSLATRLENEVRAKCSCCGVVAKAAKGRFWEQITCPKCKSTVYFVILAPSIN